MSTIKNQEKFTYIKDLMVEVDDQANLDQSVRGDDDRLLEAKTELENLRKDYISDPDKLAEIDRMLGNIDNLIGIAGNTTVRGTDSTNASWANEMDDLEQMLSSYEANGDSSTFVDGLHGTPVGSSELPKGSAAAEATNPIYDVHTTPKTYVEDDSAAKKYRLYDADGAMTKSFSYDDAKKYGIDMGYGGVLALGKDGFKASWLINGDGGREKIIPGAADPEQEVETDDSQTETSGTDTAETETSGTETADTETADTETADPDTAEIEDPKTTGKNSSAAPADGSIAGKNKGPGPGTAYKNMPTGATALPGDLAALQKTQQVNHLADAVPPVYITSSGSPAKYDVYAEDGKTKLKEGLQAPFAIGLGNGSWYAASAKGVASAWTTTDYKSLQASTPLYDLTGSTIAKNGLKSLNKTAGGATTQSGNVTTQAGTSTTAPDGSIAGKNKGPGPGTAYKNMPAGTSLPGPDLPKLQKTQQVNLIEAADGNNVYLTSGNEPPITYDMYDKDGKIIQGSLKPPFAIELADGSWYAANPEGVAKSWTTTDPIGINQGDSIYTFEGGTFVPLKKQTTQDGKTTAQFSNKLGLSKVTKQAGVPKENSYVIDLVDPVSKKNITPAALKDGQHGIYNYNSGEQYVSLDPTKSDKLKGSSGYWSVFGGTAYDFFTGQKMPKDDFLKIAKEQNLTTYSEKDEQARLATEQAQKDEAAKKEADAKSGDRPTYIAGHDNSDPNNTNQSEAPRGGGNRYHYWAGTKTNSGTAFANVWSKTQDGSKKSHWTKLVNEDNADITPSELNRGQYGSFTYKNGSQYYSLNHDKIEGSSGYWLVTGDKAKDLITGKEMDASAFLEIAKKENLPSFNQKDEEAKLKESQEAIDALPPDA